MAENIELSVHLDYDSEAKVWYVAKSDIPGLSLEAETATQLVEKVMLAAPELIELNETIFQEICTDLEDELDLNIPKPQHLSLAGRKSVRPIFDTPLELACA